MAKGFFTQGAAVLLERAISLDVLVGALEGHDIVRTFEAEAESDWMGGYAGALVAVDPSANGYALVHVVPSTWPDPMGSPELEAKLFAAWSMGWLGPLTFPGNLERAVAFAQHLDDAPQVVASHGAFVRVLTSYVLGAERDAPVLPEGYAPLPELLKVTEIARNVLALPGALAYFNPAGETLHTADSFDRCAEAHARAGLLPYDLWSAIRLISVEDLPEHSLMDTSGLGQLDLVDHEATFTDGAYDPSEVANFLRNASDYVRENGPIINDGDTMDGPGGVHWRAHSHDESLAPAPRPVLRWTPASGA